MSVHTLGKDGTILILEVKFLNGSLSSTTDRWLSGEAEGGESGLAQIAQRCAVARRQNIMADSDWAHLTSESWALLLLVFLTPAGMRHNGHDISLGQRDREISQEPNDSRGPTNKLFGQDGN